jgi:hypothetical protein
LEPEVSKEDFVAIVNNQAPALGNGSQPRNSTTRTRVVWKLEFRRGQIPLVIPHIHRDGKDFAQTLRASMRAEGRLGQQDHEVAWLESVEVKAIDQTGILLENGRRLERSKPLHIRQGYTINSQTSQGNTKKRSAMRHYEKELRQELAQKYPSFSSAQEAHLENEIQEASMKRQKILQRKAPAHEQHHPPPPPPALGRERRRIGGPSSRRTPGRVSVMNSPRHTDRQRER